VKVAKEVVKPAVITAKKGSSNTKKPINIKK